MKPDAIVEIRFNTAEEGGRRAAIVISEAPYGCVLVVDEEAFDCRVLSTGRTLELGKTYELPLKFLSPDLVLSKLAVGRPVSIWEGKEIGSGKVLQL